MNSVLTCMAAHQSVRQFEAGDIDPSMIRTAVGAAQRASTSSNIQGYCAIQVTDAKRRQQLTELCGNQSQIMQGSFFVICGDQRRHQLIAQAAERPFATNLEAFLLSVIDASLFAQNLALALESLGFGICYIGGLRNQLAEVDQLLALPQGVLPLYGFCAGLPVAAKQDEKAPHVGRPRLAPESVWFRDRYPDDRELRQQIADYDLRMGEHYAERGKPGHNWSGAISRKFSKPLREHLSSFFRSKGASFD